MTLHAKAKNYNLLLIFICKKTLRSSSKIGRARAIFVRMVKNSCFRLHKQISANVCLMPNFFVSPPWPHFLTKFGALFFLRPTNYSYFMCMKQHKFSCILGFARSESVGGQKSVVSEARMNRVKNHFHIKRFKVQMQQPIDQAF